MNVDGIFLATNSAFTVLQQQPYEREDILQRALAEHPEVLAGPTTAGTESGRLLLVRREMGVPSAESVGATWSLDHLFLDREGVPVIVEVKRSSDTRIRREVVGQMLDYAANGVRYWPISDLRKALETTAAAANRTSEDLINELQDGVDPEEFWQAVESNLRAGRIRMVFVADELPPELVSIIEFLNEQMTRAEVLGVELRQYVGPEHTVYVPRVVGRTSLAVATKGTGGTQWDEQSFLDAADTRCSPEETGLLRQLLGHCRSHGVRLSWGKGATPGVSGWYNVGGSPSAVWNVNANNENPSSRAYMYFYLGDLVKRLPADRLEMAAIRLETIPSMTSKIAEARTAGWNKYPSARLAEVVASPDATKAVFDALDILAGDQ